jgi:putative serine protease PepD
MKSTFFKVAVGFVIGATTVGGVATGAVNWGKSVTTACVDNKTGALYAALEGCAKNRTAVSLGGAGQTISGTTSANGINGVVSKIFPALVTVKTTTPNGGGTGSGSIFKTDANESWIVTNNHVVDGATSISVELDNGDEVSATLVGKDSSYDLAVIKIARGNQPTIEFGDSSAIQIGDPVIAFGSPLGLDHTVTSGIVSSLNRPVTTGQAGSTDSYVDAIQTDAAINPGNSGGPLTDSSGRMIGINSAIASLGSSLGGQSGSIGLGFSIPINEATRIINEILVNGKATRPVLGVYFDNTYTGRGAKISGTTTGDPAVQAGITAGTIITQIDGKKITDMVSAIVRIRAHSPGDKITLLTTLPSGESKSYQITLGSATSN